ncbi:MAG: ATP-binding cassette subfamily F protein 3 [Flavobacteriales bacterium]|jgi:ATP-binding cassette subfamily F protein 3
MVSVSNLTVVFGEQVLFDSISFFVTEKDKVGLVGKNGAGKSTLLKVISGLQTADGGDVSMPLDALIGYLPQELALAPTRSVSEEAALAFKELNLLEARSEAIALELATREDYETDSYNNLISELNEVNDRLHILDAGKSQENIARILKGLGFVDEDLDQPLSTFSGGWQMRVELAKLLLQQPQVLLLDEPTNHLDILSIQWLENFLKSYTGAIILISHDKAFLDNLTNRTIEIANSKIYDFKFAYSKYLVAREDDLEKQMQAYKNQQKYIADSKILIDKFRAKKNKAAFAQSLIKKLDKLELIDVDDFLRPAFNLKFPTSPRSGKVTLQAEHLSKSYGHKNVFKNLDLIVARGTKLAIVGKNGVGKTTFTKIVMGLETAEGDITIGHNVQIGYYAQNQAESLDGEKTVLQTIEDESTEYIKATPRALLGNFLFSGNDVDKKVKVLSGGEKARLAMCKLMLEPINLLILDEPTNHLDIQSKEVLKSALADFDGTLIVVSHDRDFLHGLADVVYEVTSNGMKEHLGDIYEFLQSKNAESIAQYEGDVEKEKSKTKVGSAHKLGYDERKEKKKEYRRLQNLVSKSESRITELEKKLAETDKVMEGLDYSDDSKTSTILANYAAMKKELDTTLATWEDAGHQLDIFDTSLLE